MKQSVLQNQMMRSPLLAQKRVRGHGGNSKDKNLLFSLNLTTLIDAFCILVIFLLANMNGQIEDIKIGQNISLPIALETDLLQKGVMVRVEGSHFYVDDKRVSFNELAKNLIELKSKEKNSMVIQADKNSDFEKISQLLRAGGQAGFEKYAFAVIPGK